MIRYRNELVDIDTKTNSVSVTDRTVDSYRLKALNYNDDSISIRCHRYRHQAKCSATGVRFKGPAWEMTIIGYVDR